MSHLEKLGNCYIKKTLQLKSLEVKMTGKNNYYSHHVAELLGLTRLF